MIIAENSTGGENADTAAKKFRDERALWLSGGITTACFTCFLAASTRPHSLASDSAVRLFWLAIPTLVFNMLAIREKKRYRAGFGKLSSLIPLAGVIAACVGICAFAFSYDPCAGVVAAIVMSGLVVHTGTAHRHSAKVLAKRAKRAQIHRDRLRHSASDASNHNGN